MSGESRELEFHQPSPEELEETERLRHFRDKIMAFAEEEAAYREGRKTTGHFQLAKPERERISRNALHLFEKIESGEVTHADIAAYKSAERAEKEAKIAAGVAEFKTEEAVSAYLMNLATPVLYLKEKEELRNRRNS